MRQKTIAAYLILSLVTLLAASTLLADGTLLGTINGRVLDQDGKALPGATVDLVSGDQGFRRSGVSDSVGVFNFPLLQPGLYNVTVTLSGFQSFVAKDIVVQPDKTTAVSATLRLAATEAVTVTGEAPLVDKTNSSATTNVSSTLTQKLPVARNYQNLIAFAPGISNNSSGNVNSHGSLNSTNLYLFDGVDTTDVTTGTFGQNFNYEAIQEVNVSTSGISAEYGRSQGAYVNVVTKSGTNLLHGAVKVILTNDDWNAGNKGSNPETGTPFARTKFDEIIKDYTYTLGGPIWQDHVWFFGSYENVNNTGPFRQTIESPLYPDQTGQEYQQTTRTKLWDGKLTAQITPSQLVTFQTNSDPITGFIVDYWGASANLAALTEQNQNQCTGLGCLGSISWSGVFGSAVSAEARWANQAGDIFVVPAFGHGSPFLSLADGLFYNGATFDGLVDRPRTQANVAASYYHELFGQPAQFKAGVDYQSLRSYASYTYPNNEIYIVAQYDPTKSQADQTFQVGDEWDRLTPPVPSISRGKIWGYYALEKFQAGPVALNLGVRIDHQTSVSDIGNTVIDSTKPSPRVTAAWDVMGDGKTLISAGYGRYYQFLLQSIADSIFSGVPVQTNRDIYLWDGSEWVYNSSIRAGGNNAPINLDLQPSYTDEGMLAFQRQIGNTMAVGVRGIYRKWNDLVDDAKYISPDGALIQEPFNYSSSQVNRRYKGLELSFEKRFATNWQALANYTLSRTYGNQFSDFGGQLMDFSGDNCRVTTLGVVPCNQVLNDNQQGIAGYDRTNVLNAFVAYTASLPYVNITAAPAFTFYSGTTYQEQRSVTVPSGATGYNYYFTPRGSSRLPSTYQFDFALEATFKPMGQNGFSIVGGPLEIGVKGEIFNVFNTQKVIRTDYIELRPSAGQPGGAANSIFGAPVSRNALQAPRSIRITGFIRM